VEAAGLIQGLGHGNERSTASRKAGHAQLHMPGFFIDAALMQIGSAVA
jgi:hypothetical protein